jgi:hypothetical protein
MAPLLMLKTETIGAQVVRLGEQRQQRHVLLIMFQAPIIKQLP